ncbi:MULTISPECIES: helix-turn-helix transcriptional regulator [unclassified Streptomyces]|uniref:helix-turn-helix transcriptional regulator n=1 Tax=unclassified Streptomyces TaxID=2593676 RepID=UPI002E2B5641|nr:AAA family ATPase [Streptomyces sp. NBC_01439]
MNRNGVVQRWPLVGREAELKDFDEVVSEPRSAAFLVFGPAGVGKSRLAEECLDRAVVLGHRIGRAVATSAAASVPLGAIAHLLPDGVDLSDPVSGFASVARLLSRPGTARPRMVILVDDVHLLDATSAMLLRQLMDAGVIFLLGTVRSEESQALAVAALGHGDAVRQVDLVGFTRGQVVTVLEQVLEGPVVRSAVNHLLTNSGGNPLYLRELVVGAVAAGVLTCDGEIWDMTADRLPGTRRLTDLIRSRLSVAAPAGRQVLDVLSLCEPLSLGHLEMDTEPQVLNELEQSGLIVVVQEERRSAVRLAHPLYGEVLRADMTAQRRRETLLRQVHLLKRTGARRREDAVHLATYKLAATGTANPGLLVRAAALAAHAREYPRALDLLRAIPEQHQSFQVQLLLGNTLYEAGEYQQAEDALSRADVMATTEQDVLSVLPVRIQNLLWGVGTPYEEVLDLLASVRSRVTSALGHRVLLANEAASALTVGDVGHSLALSADLELEGAHAPDGQTWLWAAMTRSTALAVTGRGEEAEGWIRRVMAFSAAVGETHSAATHEVAHRAVLVLALAESGRLAEAQEVGERAFAGLTDASATADRRLLAFYLARGTWTAGHPAQARRWFAEVARASRPYTPVVLSMALAGLAASAALQGDCEAAEAALAERDRLPAAGFFPEESLGEAWLYVARGELTRARTVLTAAAREAFERGETASEAILLTDLVRLGQAGEAAVRLTEIAQERTGRFHRARADLAVAWSTRDPDGLLAAADALQAMGADLLAAEAASTAAAALRTAGQTRRANAAAVRSDELAARCEGARTPALMACAEVVQLTVREREIALLASRGMLSKDIAAALTISVRTVDNHLQRIYNKLGITTRKELADRLLP